MSCGPMGLSRSLPLQPVGRPLQSSKTPEFYWEILTPDTACRPGSSGRSGGILPLFLIPSLPDP